MGKEIAAGLTIIFVVLTAIMYCMARENDAARNEVVAVWNGD